MLSCDSVLLEVIAELSEDRVKPSALRRGQPGEHLCLPGDCSVIALSD